MNQLGGSAFLCGDERPRRLLKDPGGCHGGSGQNDETDEGAAPGRGGDRDRQSRPRNAPSFDLPKPAGAPKRKRLPLRRRTAGERIAAATQQLAGGVTEASAAVEELRRSLEQISTSAEEAAGASHESLAAVAALSATFAQSRDRAEEGRRRTEALQDSLIAASTGRSETA